MASSQGHSSPRPDSPLNGNNGGSPQQSEKNPHRRCISLGEWTQFCRGIGVLKDDESHQVIRSTCRIWPPYGLKDGLYRDVLFQKSKFSYSFHLLNTAQWGMMLIQLASSAVLTALGSLPNKTGPTITVIAAANTCIAGVLALIHNSGVPYRYRLDSNEFSKLEDHLKAIIETGLVPAHQDIHEVLADCFDMYRAARQTVQDNVPSSYMTGVPSAGTATGAAPKTPAPRNRGTETA
ncbi:hypothetical protein F4810DRAFT_691403 [Camillea tinctor]|nr:hypothetical protein F4810DRAFT_691403 [Camillea tinctor]